MKQKSVMVKVEMDGIENVMAIYEKKNTKTMTNRIDN